MDNIEQVVDNMDVGDLQEVLLGGKAKMESGSGAVSDPIQSAVDGMSTKDLSQVLLGEDGEGKPIEESQEDIAKIISILSSKYDGKKLEDSGEYSERMDSYDGQRSSYNSNFFKLVDGTVIHEDFDEYYEQGTMTLHEFNGEKCNGEYVGYTDQGNRMYFTSTLMTEDGKKLTQEGGNKFKNASRINQENAGPTMDDLKKKLHEFFGLTDDEIIFTGSTGRRKPGGSSGDMDCSIPRKVLRDKFGVETPDEWFDVCRDFAEKYNLEISVMPEFKWEGVSFNYPIVNADGKQEGKFVQLDFVPVENLKLRAWSLHTQQEVEGEPYVKGMVRCLIMMEIASLSGYKVLETGIVNKREGEHPIKWEAYSYSYQTDGLYKNTYKRELMPGKRGEEGVHYAKSERVDQELITDDPDEICEILFGVDSANMLTWEDAWNAAKKVGIFDDPKKEEMFKKKLKKGFETSIKKGNLPYLPPEIANYLDIDVDALFGTRKKKWDDDEGAKAAQ